MTNQRALRVLIIADIILLVLGIAAEIALESTLPAPLRKYVDEQLNADLSLSDMPMLALFFVMVSLLISAWISLYNFWKYGPALYVAALVLACVGSAFGGPTVTTSTGSVVEDLKALTTGLILGLVYFSDLRERFRPPSDPSLRSG